MPVMYQAESGCFMATLLRKGMTDNFIVFSNDTVNDGDGVMSALSDKERLVLESIMQKNDSLAQEIAEKINVSIITVKRAISKLKASGLIVRVGSDKKGSWSVKGKI